MAMRCGIGAGSRLRPTIAASISNLNIPLREDAFGAMGTFSGSTDASHFGIDTPGVWLSDGGSSPDDVTWPSNARLDIARNISIMVVARMKTTPAAPYNSVVFGRGTDFAPGNYSWSLNRESVTGGNWLWQFINGGRVSVAWFNDTAVPFPDRLRDRHLRSRQHANFRERDPGRDACHNRRDRQRGKADWNWRHRIFAGEQSANLQSVCAGDVGSRADAI